MFNQDQLRADAKTFIDLMEHLTRMAIDGSSRMAGQSFAMSRAAGEAYASYAKTMGEIMHRSLASVQAQKS